MGLYTMVLDWGKRVDVVITRTALDWFQRVTGPIFAKYGDGGVQLLAPDQWPTLDAAVIKGHPIEDLCEWGWVAARPPGK